jgi:hypothetical protein
LIIPRSDHFTNNSGFEQDKSPIPSSISVNLIQDFQGPGCGYSSTSTSTSLDLNSNYSEYNIFSDNYLGQNWYYKGVSLISESGEKWISSKTGEEVTLQKLTVFRDYPCYNSILETSRKGSCDELLSLPSEDKIDKILTAYFGSCFYTAFPILEKGLFKKTLDLAYLKQDSGTSTLECLASKVCVLAVPSLVCRLEELGDPLLDLDGDILATKAYKHFMQLTGVFNLTNLQTAIILVSYSSRYFR